MPSALAMGLSPATLPSQEGCRTRNGNEGREELNLLSSSISARLRNRNLVLLWLPGEGERGFLRLP